MHSPESNYFSKLGSVLPGFACWEGILRCSKVQKYLNFWMVTFSCNWGPYLGAPGGCEWHSSGRKSQKNVFFKDLKPGMVLKTWSKMFLKKRYRWAPFLIHNWGPIWGPCVTALIYVVIFAIIILPRTVFQIKIATWGPPIRAPK